MFNRSKRNLKNKKGFTLIELVVVIAVIGILAAIAIPRVTGITSNAKDKATMQHIAVLNSALERYIAEDKSLGNADEVDEVIAKLQAEGYLKTDVTSALPNGETLEYSHLNKKFSQEEEEAEAEKPSETEGK